MKNIYSLRRDSLISPWGIGAIVPFPHDESLMVSGLDYWFDEDHTYTDFLIQDERLTKRLGGKLFVMPPDFLDYRQDAAHANMRIPAVRFPLWHYCPVCGNMDLNGEAGGRMRCSGENRLNKPGSTYCSKNVNRPKSLPLMIPERFIAVCPKGHIEDFPIIEWVHAKSGKPVTDECRLVRSTGGSSSALSGIRYRCTCGAAANMGGAFGTNALSGIGYRCSGKRPWLGRENSELCGEQLMVLQRGASNVWFADIISSVYIPNIPKYKNSHTKECIDMAVKKFGTGQQAGNRFDDEAIKKFIQAHQLIYEDIDAEQAFEEISATLQNAQKEYSDNQTDDEYRKQEFDVLIASRGKPSDELYTVNYKSDCYTDLKFIKSISLVHKLRETRAFLGFKRISPENDPAKISVNELPWIPAIKNSGEGIMFEFDLQKLDTWAMNEKVIKRTKIIQNNLKKSGKLQNKKINPVYILLHTFAHCLINSLANNSGYSNASIREKIYCNKYIEENSPKMAGILIYTASGDSEGSLGGLVRQGLPGRIEEIINQAINEARWCAADPVCIQSTGQGQNGCNLAACHNCALLPETSCENKNMLLDRGLMIGTLDDNSLGYFNSYEKY